MTSLRRLPLFYGTSHILCSIPVVRKHAQSKSPAQMRVFESHIQRYLQAYLPDAGFEYAVTHRYHTARLRRLEALGGIHDRATGAAGLGIGRTDLCVLAMRSFQPDDIITHCRAALKDLSREEDETLREEAIHARSGDLRNGHTRPQRDFSIIRSSSRKLSQLLLGPARFINHDCQPNAEFRRSGHQLTIRCIRPIQRNEEITTFYGENYFELNNKECMCATCERLGRGFFSADKEQPEPAPTGQGGDERTLRSSSSSAALPVAPPPVDMINYALDPDATGPECECLTCKTAFRAPERWWTPDECVRCERHYKLYKCDWPSRSPKENPAESHSNVRPLKRSAPQSQRPPKRQALSLDSPAASETSSPVKLSPMRSFDSDEERPASSDTRHGRRKFEVRSDDSDEGFDDNHVTLGPRILGHDASTDVLASYWGAPSGQRRERRPANLGLESLSDRIASRRVNGHEHGHRRKASDMSVKSERATPSFESKSKSRTPAPAPTEAVIKTERATPVLEKKGPASLPPDAGRAVSLPPAPSQRTSKHARSASGTYGRPPEPAKREQPASPARERPASRRERPVSPPKPAIATKGPERTSVSNLALFWSGGVEGRTRRRAREQHKPEERPLRGRPSSESREKRAKEEAANAPKVDKAKVERPPPEPERPERQDRPEHDRLDTEKAERAVPSPPSTVSTPNTIKSESTSRPTSPLPSDGPPRQPARRNLRWGSGKSSISRPLPGNSASTGISLLSALTGRASPTTHVNGTPSRAPDERSL